MTTAAELIQQAYREGNLLEIGKSPTSEEQVEALARLNNYITALFGVSLGEFIGDWTVPPSRSAPVNARFPLSPLETALPSDIWPYLPNNVRIVSKIIEATTIYLPFDPNDGATLGLADAGSTADLTIDANGRKIEGAATLTITPATVGTARWMYRADTATWTRIQALALTDESPLPIEFDDLLICGLAIRLAPRNGQQPLAVTREVEQTMKRRLKMRYLQKMDANTGYSPRRLSLQAHSRGYTGSRGLL